MKRIRHEATLVLGGFFGSVSAEEGRTGVVHRIELHERFTAALLLVRLLEHLELRDAVVIEHFVVATTKDQGATGNELCKDLIRWVSGLSPCMTAVSRSN